MPPTRLSYPNSTARPQAKNQAAAIFSSQRHLRGWVCAAMVEVHRIAPELAAFHVSQMDLEELYDRFRSYAGMELSVAGPFTPERSTSVLPGSDARNDDGRLAALNCIPGVCPICLERRPLVRDHDWKTGMVRGRICERCNGNLGAIENHPAWDAKTLGPRWWKWFFDNQHRIAQHLESNTGEQYSPESARFGKRETGSEGRGVFCPGCCLIRKKRTGNVQSGKTVSEEGLLTLGS